MNHIAELKKNDTTQKYAEDLVEQMLWHAEAEIVERLMVEYPTAKRAKVEQAVRDVISNAQSWNSDTKWEKVLELKKSELERIKREYQQAWLDGGDDVKSTTYLISLGTDEDGKPTFHATNMDEEPK